MNERYKHIDLGAGIMILWMIIYHAWQAGLCLEEAQRIAECGGEWMEISNPMQTFPFLLFFMPWFFYKSGMFFRIRPAKELFIYDCKKLIKPFVIWSLVGYVCYVVMCLLDGTATLHRLTYSVIRGAFLTERIPINKVLWFLMTLFFVRQISNVALKKVHPLFIALLGVVIAYVCHLTEFRLMPDWVPNSGIGLFFFSIGYWLNHNVQISQKVKNTTSWISLFVFCMWCIISYMIPNDSLGRIPIVEMVENLHIQGIYILWYAICFLGIIGFNLLIRKSESLPLSFLSWMGKNAMLIYIIHYIPCQILSWVANVYCIRMSAWLLIGLILVSYVVLFAIIKIKNGINYLPQ